MITSGANERSQTTLPEVREPRGHGSSILRYVRILDDAFGAGCSGRASRAAEDRARNARDVRPSCDSVRAAHRSACDDELAASRFATERDHAWHADVRASSDPGTRARACCVACTGALEAGGGSEFESHHARRSAASA